MAGILDIKQSALNRMQEKHANNYVTKPVAFSFLLGLLKSGLSMPRDLSTTGLLESRRGIFRLGMTFGVAPYRVRRPPLGLAKNKSRKRNGMRFFSLHGRVCYRFTPPRRLFYSLGLENSLVLICIVDGILQYFTLLNPQQPPQILQFCCVIWPWAVSL
jgi:hypothetical protein